MNPEEQSILGASYERADQQAAMALHHAFKIVDLHAYPTFSGDLWEHYACIKKYLLDAYAPETTEWLEIIYGDDIKNIIVNNEDELRKKLEDFYNHHPSWTKNKLTVRKENGCYIIKYEGINKTISVNSTNAIRAFANSVDSGANMKLLCKTAPVSHGEGC